MDLFNGVNRLQSNERQMVPTQRVNKDMGNYTLAFQKLNTKLTSSISDHHAYIFCPFGAQVEGKFLLLSMKLI
jgi:hypothetical protein